MMALIMLLLSPDPPTHLDRKNNRSCKLDHTVHKGKAGEREPALGQVAVSRHKESSSLFLWLFFLCFAAFYNTTAELQPPRLRSSGSTWRPMCLPLVLGVSFVLLRISRVKLPSYHRKHMLGITIIGIGLVKSSQSTSMNSVVCVAFISGLNALEYVLPPYRLCPIYVQEGGWRCLFWASTSTSSIPCSTLQINFCGGFCILPKLSVSEWGISIFWCDQCLVPNCSPVGSSNYVLYFDSTQSNYESLQDWVCTEMLLCGASLNGTVLPPFCSNTGGPGDSMIQIPGLLSPLT